MEPIASSETSAVRTQTPGNYPKGINYNIKVVLINFGDVRLIYADRGMDKAKNIRCNEQIALKQQLVSQTYIKFIINFFRLQSLGSNRKWRAKYGSPLSLFNWVSVFQRISDCIPMIAVRNKCTGWLGVLGVLRMLRSTLRDMLPHDAHLANYTLYNRFLHNMICCHNTLFTNTN